MHRPGWIFVFLAIAVIVSACSADSSAPSVTEAPSQAADSNEATVDDSTDATEANDEDAPIVTGIDFQVFFSDEGAGCGIYVSVPEADAVSGDIRQLIWQGVVEADLTDCGFSDVVEVGLITVDGLDEYNQPDWSTATEHGYFAVGGWDNLVDQCFTSLIDDACAALLETTFLE